MPPATISNLASARSPVRATSCRHCARDDTTNRNRCNRRFAPAIASPRLFADEKHFREARVVAQCRRLGRREMLQNLARLSPGRPTKRKKTVQRIAGKHFFDPEIPVTGNDPALPERKDRQSDRRWRLRRAVLPPRGLKDTEWQILERKMRIGRDLDKTAQRRCHAP